MIQAAVNLKDTWPNGLRLHRLTVEEYHKMIQAGVLTEDDRVELLEGLLVEKMTQDPPHAGTVTRLQRRLSRLLPDEWLLRIQLPITLSESEPEPDLVVAKGPEDAYDQRHPVPRDVALAIEVADTSLDTDRELKLTVYARERLPAYWIVNLIDGSVEVYTNPRGGRAPLYRQAQTFTREQTLPLVVAGKQLGKIAVAELLP